MACSQFSPVQTCQNIQLIEPDFTLPTELIPPPGSDPGLTESGSVPLDVGVGLVSVTFLTPKAGDYRFEYLYIDGVATGGMPNPVSIPVVPITQTIYGFRVDLSGVPVQTGYTLRWHVVVISIATPGAIIYDLPEVVYAVLPRANNFTYTFVNPRSSALYGFSELRVENLRDTHTSQRPTLVQVYAKTQFDFSVAISPTPNTDNYILVARTP